MAKNKPKIPTTWDLTPLFKGDDDPKLKAEEARSIKLSEQFVKKWEPRTDWLKNPKALKEALDDYSQWLKISGTNAQVCYYWWLRSSQEQDNPKVKARTQLADDVNKKLWNKIQFFELRLAKVDSSLQERFLSDKSLSTYKHFLKKLFANAKYTLTEAEEKILTLTSQPAHSDWTSMVLELLTKKELEVLNEKGKKTKKPMTMVISLLTNKNKKIRDTAAKAFNEHLADYVDIAEHELNAILGYKKTTDELRGLKRPDEARHVSDDIESEVVDALIKAVTKKFSIAKRYYALKARLLGQERLAYHERNMTVGEFEKKFTYEKSVALVSKVLSDLDSEFGNIFDQFVRTGKIDVFPKRGKMEGAFCVHDLISMPVFILLNHDDKLRDVLTIAHEVGHGINNELMKKQPTLYFATSLATAEVASTFMEDFVLEEVVRKSTEKEQLSLLMQKLNDDVSSIFRQAALYRFEQELHKTRRETGYLSKEVIGKLFQKHMSAYMGPAVEKSFGSENWWIYWDHIRRFFYVYSYVSGLLISKSLQNMVRADKSKIGLVKEFLSAGTSDSPRNIFLKLGIDIADAKFWEKGLAEIETNLKEAERLARSLDKKKKRA